MIFVISVTNYKRWGSLIMLPLKKGAFAVIPFELLRGLPPFEQLILIWLCIHSDKDGICWPSFQTLAKESGLSRITIIRKLKILEEKGLIIRNNTQPFTKEFSSNSYKIITNQPKK